MINHLLMIIRYSVDELAGAYMYFSHGKQFQKLNLLALQNLETPLHGGIVIRVALSRYTDPARHISLVSLLSPDDLPFSEAPFHVEYSVHPTLPKQTLNTTQKVSRRMPLQDASRFPGCKIGVSYDTNVQVLFS